MSVIVPLGTIDPTLYLQNRQKAISWLEANSLVAPVEITVYWGDMDANSHVSNVRYFNWLENGRIGVLKHFDGPKAANGKGTGYILGKVANTYVKPVFAPDHLMLGHTIASIGLNKFEVKTIMYSFRQDCVVSVSTATMVAYDYDAEKAILIDAEMRKRLQANLSQAKL